MAKRLSQRLSRIAEMVPEGVFLADVGSDHAWLPIYLVESGKVPWAMAIDNKVGPFLRLKENVDASSVGNRILCSRSDGISEITESVDCVALCGMGGLLSCDILEAHKEKLPQIQTIVMDPHRDLLAVRKRVSALGYHLIDESMVYEDKVYYTVLLWAKGAPSLPYNEAELALGPILLHKEDAVYDAWLHSQREKLQGLLQKDLDEEKRAAYKAAHEMIVWAIGLRHSDLVNK